MMMDILLFPFAECANCEKDINESQALIALDKHWHMDCFRCLSCKTQLAGEYMGRLVLEWGK